MKYLCQISGGRDSTAMSLKMLEIHGTEQVDLIFCDTGAELPKMYEYLRKLDAFLKRKYNKNIIVIKPILKTGVAGLKDIEITTTENLKFDFENGGFLKLVRAKITKEQAKKEKIVDEKEADTLFKVETPQKPTKKAPSKIGKTRGVPISVGMSPCTNMLKILPFQMYAKRNHNLDDIEVCIGFVHREQKRIGKMQQNVPYKLKFPLVEIGWDEPQVDAYLKELSIYNELYTHYDRTGCFLCPKQSVGSWRALHEKYPELFKRTMELEKECKDGGYLIPYFKSDRTPLSKSDIRYTIEAKTGKLFDDRDWVEEEQTCMCKF